MQSFLAAVVTFKNTKATVGHLWKRLNKKGALIYL